MKKILFVLILFSPFLGFNQDIIFKIDGSEIKAKVIEITPDMVKYKSFDNLDGPLYNLNLRDVFKIKYQNGKDEVFTKTNEIKQNNLPVEEPPKNDLKLEKSENKKQKREQKEAKNKKHNIGFGMGVFTPFKSYIAKEYGATFAQGSVNFTYWLKNIGPRIDISRATVGKTSSGVTSELMVNSVSTYITNKVAMDKPKVYPYYGAGIDVKFIKNKYSYQYSKSNTYNYVKSDIGFLVGYRVNMLTIESKFNPNISGSTYGLGGLWVTVGLRW